MLHNPKRCIYVRVALINTLVSTTNLTLISKKPFKCPFSQSTLFCFRSKTTHHIYQTVSSLLLITLARHITIINNYFSCSLVSIKISVHFCFDALLLFCLSVLIDLCGNPFQLYPWLKKAQYLPSVLSASL
jgi:hypothetical protein